MRGCMLKPKLYIFCWVFMFLNYTSYSLKRLEVTATGNSLRTYSCVILKYQRIFNLISSSSENLHKLHKWDFYSRQELSTCKPYKKVDLLIFHPKLQAFLWYSFFDTTLSSLRVSVHPYSVFPSKCLFPLGYCRVI